MFTKYLDFINVFFLKFTFELFKYIRINSYIIKLINNPQLFYKVIYSLKFILKLF